MLGRLPVRDHVPDHQHRDAARTHHRHAGAAAHHPDGQDRPAVRLRHRVRRRRRRPGRRRRRGGVLAASTWTPPAAPGWSILIAIANAVLGVALGLFCSAFARTEFQAVQFMPVVVVPQLLLCGLFVPRDQMAGWLQAISNVLPMTYAVEALQEVGAHAEPTGALWRDLGIVVGCVVRGPDARGGCAATLTARRYRRDAAAVTGSAARTGPAPPGNPDTREAILARRPRRRSPSAATTPPRSAPSRPRPGSTPPWCTTTSAPRTSCSWPRCRPRSTRPSAARGARRRAGRDRGAARPHVPRGLGLAGRRGRPRRCSAPR